MTTFAVVYDYTDDTATRDEFRVEHREYLNSSGWALLSGPMTDPDGALLIITADDAATAERQLDGDPFWREGCIAHRSIRPYNPIGGDLAKTFEGYTN